MAKEWVEVNLMVEDTKADDGVAKLLLYGFTSLLHLSVYTGSKDTLVLLKYDAYSRLHKLYKYRGTEKDIREGKFTKILGPNEFEDKSGDFALNEILNAKDTK